MITIIGAGAAGLMAAIFAARSGRPVVVIETTRDGGRKILISGGGRCNVLPSALAPERFVTGSAAHVMRAMLRSWPLVEQRRFFEEELHIPLALEAETGKLFPVSNRARDIRDALIDCARGHGAAFQFETTVDNLAPGAAGWTLQTSRGPILAKSVVLATGGLSVPATGSDGTGLRVAGSLGHRIRPTYPALTPLTATPAVHAPLSGVSLTVRLRARSGGRTTESSGGFLFTHRGYSGPAVLDVSHIAAMHAGDGDDRPSVRVQWGAIDRTQWESAFAPAAGLVATAVASRLPQRLAATLIHEAGVPADRRVSDLRRSERLALVERLTSYELPWTGDEGFKKAEVTGGGVALDAVDPATLESRSHPGLFLCGEMLDAFGPIGGHNFVWAWATGRLAGLGAAR